MELSTPSVSVVICHHTGRDLVERCLKSVAASEGVEVETIVVTSDVSYLPEEVKCYFLNDGPAAKRNLGVKHASSDTIIFLDDDVTVGPYTCYEFWHQMEDHPEVGMGFGKVYNAERRKEFDDCGSFLTPTGFLWARAGNAQIDRGQYDRAEPILASKSATCVIRRHLFWQIGGFDPDFQILAEETQLAYKVWLVGWQVWYFPSAHSWHYFNTSFKPKAIYYTPSRIHFLGARNYLWFLMTCLGMSRLIWILPLHWSIWGFSTLGFLIRGEWQQARLILQGMFTPLFHPVQIWRKRQNVQSLRIRSDRAILTYGFRSPPLSYYGGRLTRYWTQQTHG